MLIDRLVISQHLTRMSQITESVNDRNRRIPGEVHHIVMSKGTNHDTVQIAGHNLCCITDRLPTPQLDIVLAQEQGVTAQLIHTYLEGYTCTGRGFLKNQSQGFSLQRLIDLSTLVLLLNIYRKLNQIFNLLGSKVI
ncbi:hypothetical protein D3C71_1858960 [compost metagenome]